MVLINQLLLAVGEQGIEDGNAAVAITCRLSFRTSDVRRMEKS